MALHLLALGYFWIHSPWVEGPQAGGGGEISIVHLSPSAYSVIPRSGSQTPSGPLTTVASSGSEGQAGQISGMGSGRDSGLGSGPQGESEILAQIRSAIERAKRYPLRARAMKIQGTTHLQFLIQDDGTVQNLKILQSSGSPILDEEAVLTIQRASPFPTYPQPLTLAIQFELE